jgi:hypothetical protein
VHNEPTLQQFSATAAKLIGDSDIHCFDQGNSFLCRARFEHGFSGGHRSCRTKARFRREIGS